MSTPPPPDMFEDVLQFHRKFGLVIKDFPMEVAFATQALRDHLVTEESKELIEAINAGNLTGIADACADLIYIVLGTAISYGIDLRPIWIEVQRTNMLKEGGSVREDGKILKPAGWTPPDIGNILLKQVNEGNLGHDSSPSLTI